MILCARFIRVFLWFWRILQEVKCLRNTKWYCIQLNDVWSVKIFHWKLSLSEDKRRQPTFSFYFFLIFVFLFLKRILIKELTRNEKSHNSLLESEVFLYVLFLLCYKEYAAFNKNRFFVFCLLPSIAFEYALVE